MVEGLKGSPIPQAPAKGRKPVEPTTPERSVGAPEAVSPRARVAAPPLAAGASPREASLPGSSVRGLVRDLAKSPPVDASRVADLRARIASGVYTSDPQAIADAMLRVEGN